MKIYLSYGSREDQVTALRLQTLGVVYGLTVYVPPAEAWRRGDVWLEMQDKIDACDVFVQLDGEIMPRLDEIKRRNEKQKFLVRVGKAGVDVSALALCPVSTNDRTLLAGLLAVATGLLTMQSGMQDDESPAV